MTDVLLNTLRKSPLFEQVSEDLLQMLSENAKLVSFSSGQSLIAEGKQVENLVLVVEGSIKVFTNAFGKHVDLKEMGPGDYVGEVSLLSGKAATATVQAASDVEALLLPKKAIQDAVAADENLRKRIEGTTLQRAKDTLGKVLQ